MTGPFQGIDFSVFDSGDSPAVDKDTVNRARSAQQDITSKVDTALPKSPIQNTIRSLDKSDLESPDTANAIPGLSNVDFSAFNDESTNVDKFINDVTPAQEAPNVFHTMSEIALNLMSLTPQGIGEDAARRRANFINNYSQLPEGHGKQAVTKAVSDLVGAAETLFNHSSFGTALGVATGKLSPSELSKRNKDEFKALGKGIGDLASFGAKGAVNIVSNPVTGVPNFFGSIVHSLITDPINRIFGAATGTNAAKDFSVMTPEERAADIKFTGALVVTGFAGRGINSVIGEGITEVPIMSSGKIVNVAGRKAFRRIGIGAIEGGASGTIFGAISRAGGSDNDYYAGIVTDALMFGSFGSTLNLLVGKKPISAEKLDAVAYAARLLQTNGENTLGQIVSRQQAVLTSDNIIQAAIKGQIVLDPDKAHVFIGINDGRAAMDALGKGANIRKNPTGGWDLLYIGKDVRESGAKIDVEMWHRTGFMSGQTVALAGKEYKIIGEGKATADGLTIRLQDKNGIEIEMPAAGIRNTPGAEFRGRSQARQPNTLFSGTAYRGTRGGVEPLEAGHVGATFMTEDPVFASIHGDANGAVHEITYDFKNPKQIPEPPDINTRQQYIKDEIQKAYEEGHDGLFIGELGGDRTEIIDVTNNKSALKVGQSIERSAFTADDVDFYVNEIRPRMEDGATFQDAVLDALGLTAKDLKRVNVGPKDAPRPDIRVRSERGFEKTEVTPVTEQPKEPVIDNRPESVKAKYSNISDLYVLQDINTVKNNIERLEKYGPSAALSINETDIYSLRHKLRELEQEAAIRDISEQKIADRYKDLGTHELENAYALKVKELGDLQELLAHDPSNEAEISRQAIKVSREVAELNFVLERREKIGTGPMLEFKRRPDSALKDTKVLDEHGNAKIVYHGTGVAFSEFDPNFLNNYSLKGPGFYFTENPNIATGYAETLLSPEIEANVIYFKDLVKEHEAKVEARINLLKERDKANPGHLINQPEHDIELSRLEVNLNTVRHSLEEAEKEIESHAPNIQRVKLNIKNPFDTDKIYTLEETAKIFGKLGIDRDRFLNSVTKKGFSGDEILDEIRSAADDSEIPVVLKEAGYDGITHIGGGNTGNAPHRVWIAFDPKQVHSIDADLIKIDRTTLDYTPPTKNPEFDPITPIVRVAKQMELIHNLLGQDKDPYAMVQVAGTNGFNLTVENGMTVIKDAESGLSIASFASAEKAREFIQNSGQQYGIDLTDGNNFGGDGAGGDGVPPIGSEGTMTPDGPAPNNLTPFPFRGAGKIESFFDALNLAVPYIAMKRTYFLSVDKLHGTALFSKVYQPTQIAALKALAVTRELMTPLAKIEKKAKGLNLERRAVIGRYIETMSPQQIIDGLFSRPLNSNEISIAKHFAGVNDGNPVNIDAVYDYLRDAKKLNSEYEKLITEMEETTGSKLDPEKANQTKAQLETELKQLQDLHGLEPKDLEAAAIFEQIKRQNLNDASLFGITELAKAITEDRPDRVRFAKENNMSAKELEIAKDFDNLYSTLADVFGIDEARRIRGFLNHYRNHREMPQVPIEKPLQGKTSAAEFASKLIRSGELYDYINDPFHAAAAYIRSGVNARVLNKVWADAKAAAQLERAKLPAGAQKQFSRVTDEYLNEIKGIPGAGDTAMQSAFDAFMAKIGVKTSKKVRGDIVNGVLGTVSSALLGFKPELGLRDIGSWFTIHGSRFGFVRATRALRYAFEKDADGISVADKMLREGNFPGLSPIGVTSASELAAIEHGVGIGGRIAKFGEAVGEAGLKVSLQKNFYAKMHAGAYLEANRLAVKNLADFRAGKITREAAYDALDMHSYEGPVAKHFDELVLNGKDQEAAHFLGLATAIETNFFHGIGNHPYKWGTNLGRIGGQYGQWSMFGRDYLVRLATRGSAKQRAAAIGRFAIAQTAIGGVGRLLGFNMRAWQVLPGLAFTGGPLLQTLYESPSLTGVRGSQKQKAAIGLFLDQHLTLGGFRSMFFPGSYAFHDVMSAYAASKDGYGLIPVVGRGFGFKIDNTQRSFLDDWTGNYPVVHPEKPLTTYLQQKIDRIYR